MKDYPKDLKIVFKQQPLPFHKDARPAAKASLAAAKQGKFWEYHDVLFENMKKLKPENLEEYAKGLKLNMKKFKKALDDGTYKAQVDADLKLGGEVNVSGTPTMFLNGKRVANATAFAAIAKDIDAALAN